MLFKALQILQIYVIRSTGPVAVVVAVVVVAAVAAAAAAVEQMSSDESRDSKDVPERFSDHRCWPYFAHSSLASDDSDGIWS